MFCRCTKALCFKQIWKIKSAWLDLMLPTNLTKPVQGNTRWYKGIFSKSVQCKTILKFWNKFLSGDVELIPFSWVPSGLNLSVLNFDSIEPLFNSLLGPCSVLQIQFLLSRTTTKHIGKSSFLLKPFPGCIQEKWKGLLVPHKSSKIGMTTFNTQRHLLS